MMSIIALFLFGASGARIHTRKKFNFSMASPQDDATLDALPNELTYRTVCYPPAFQALFSDGAFCDAGFTSTSRSRGIMDIDPAHRTSAACTNKAFMKYRPLGVETTKAIDIACCTTVAGQKEREVLIKPFTQLKVSGFEVGSKRANWADMSLVETGANCMPGAMADAMEKGVGSVPKDQAAHFQLVLQKMNAVGTQRQLLSAIAKKKTGWETAQTNAAAWEVLLATDEDWQYLGAPLTTDDRTVYHKLVSRGNLFFALEADVTTVKSKPWLGEAGKEERATTYLYSGGAYSFFNEYLRASFAKSQGNRKAMLAALGRFQRATETQAYAKLAIYKPWMAKLELNLHVKALLTGFANAVGPGAKSPTFELRRFDSESALVKDEDRLSDSEYADYIAEFNAEKDRYKIQIEKNMEAKTLFRTIQEKARTFCGAKWKQWMDDYRHHMEMKRWCWQIWLVSGESGAKPMCKALFDGSDPLVDHLPDRVQRKGSSNVKVTEGEYKQLVQEHRVYKFDFSPSHKAGQAIECP